MINLKCKKCNKTIANDSHGNRKFCSQQCSDIYYDEYRENWKTNHPEIEQDYTKNGSRCYNNIQQRCENTNHPAYRNYGGRGIRLNLSREEFLEIYFSSNNCGLCGQAVNDENRNAKDGRTLDRIDPSKSYEPDNLRILCRSCNCSNAYKRRKYKI